MEGMNVKDKDIVVPGDVLASGLDYLPSGSVFRDGDKLVASRIGLVSLNGRFVKVIPLTSIYVPKRRDIIIGKIVDMTVGGWRVDIGWYNDANLSLRDATSEFVEKGADLGKYYNYGDYIVAEISNVLNYKLVDLRMKGPGLRKLGPGRFIKVNPAKVPRVIGKQGSMISMIKEATGCKISVGQNGVVWVSGDDSKNEILAINTIRKIEDESHISGLTERIKEFLEKQK